MTARRLSIPATISWLLAAIALWVSFGALTAIADRSTAARAAFVPSPLWLGVFAAAALVLSLIFRRRATWLLSLSALGLLPWLPFPVPLSFLVWTGPLRRWLWLIILVSIVAAVLRSAASARPWMFASARNPARAPLIAAAVAAIAYLAGAWFVFPHLPAGDEPHYLVMAQSLLRDHDLKIENNHRQGDYREYFGGELRPDYLRRGTDGEIYSIHPTGLPVVVAPVYALGGYPAVLAVLALAGAIATGLTWVVVWRQTHDAAATWFAWAAVSLSAPFFFQAFTVYPDAPGAAIVMVGLLALSSARTTPARLAWTGAALALLPWFHTRFAVLEASLIVVLLVKVIQSDRPWRHVVALLAVPVLSALGWFGFFYAIYGTPNPAAPYNGYTQSEIGNLVRGIPGLLFDHQFGLIPSAPVYLCAALGVLLLFRRAPHVAVTLLIIVVPYSLMAAMYAMWWAGYSSPSRFLVPILLTLAIPIGVCFASLQSRSARLLACAALLVSLVITATLAGVDRGGLLFNVRDGSSRLMLWLSPSVEVSSGLPSLFRTSPLRALMNAAVWLAAVAIVVAAGRALDRRRISSAALATILGFTLAATSTLALSLVWYTNGAAPLTLTTGGAALLRQFDPDDGPMAIRYAPLRRLPLQDLPPAITLVRAAPGSRKPDEPLIWVPDLPAGTYEIESYTPRPASGRISVTMDREFGPAWSWKIDGAPGLRRDTVTIPVPMHVLLVDADAEARTSLEYLSVRAVRVHGHHTRVADDVPWHVVRYGHAVVFLMSGHAYVEPGGTWVAGGESAEFVIAPDPDTSTRLFVRNFAARNQVALESGTWRQVLTLEPREERLLDLPIDRERGGARLRVTTSSGARPSEVESSDDRRLLGCWIETR